jgi:nicotinamidase-related amidase
MEALVIIDVQNGLMNKDLFKKEEFLQNINKAIIENRKNNNLIIFIQHNSKSLIKGSNDWEIYSGLNINKNDIIIQKKHGSAFNETNLKQLLIENNIKNIIICGLVSNGCVYFSCKDGIENGFNVKIIKNGHTNWLKEAEDKINEVNKKLEDMGIILL